MIGYALRVGGVLLRHASLGPRAIAGEPFVLHARAWPWLCDAYLHVNNAAYLRLAEEARWAWSARTPVLRHSLKNGWAFLVGGADVVYRRPITLMSAFQIVSSIEGIDERWLYFSQQFLLPSGETACRILLRATVRSREGTVAPKDVLALTGDIAKEPSEELQQLRSLADSQLSAMKAASLP